MKKLKHLLLSLSLCSSLCASTEKTIDEKNPIHVSFSKETHNRISLETGAILKVIADPNIFSINIDKDTGHAYISILGAPLMPATLTVITNSGFVQDLIVHTREGLLEHLILQEPEDEEGSEDTEMMSSKTPTVEFLNQILEGGIPRGYGERAVLDKDHLSLPSPLKVFPIKVLEGVYETIILYTIENTAKTPIVISSEALKQKNSSWVFLNAHEIKKNEQILCIIAFNK